MPRRPKPRQPPPHARPKAQRAKEIIQSLVAHTAGAFAEAARHDTQRFMGRWIAFNALYRGYFNGSEREQLMACVRDCVPDAVAETILSHLRQEIDFLRSLPPGDMRFWSDPKRFRVRSITDMAVVSDATRAAGERLAHLVAVVYQVRCNLFHGEKNPAHLRDHELIRSGDRVLEVLLGELV